MFSRQTVNPKFDTMHLEFYIRFLLTTIMIADKLLHKRILQSLSKVGFHIPFILRAFFKSKQTTFSYLFEAFAN